MKTAISDISPIPTSHDCGRKKVLFLGKDFHSPVTQIAVTSLSEGETVPEHIHPTMDEFFLVRKGTLTVCAGGNKECCREDDFIYVPAGTTHSLKATTCSEILTIGCETEAEK